MRAAPGMYLLQTLRKRQRILQINKSRPLLGGIFRCYTLECVDSMGKAVHIEKDKANKQGIKQVGVAGNIKHNITFFLMEKT